MNGKKIPADGLSLNMEHEKTYFVGYRTLFEASGTHHSNSGPQITNDMCINGFFLMLFDLKPDLGAAEGHSLILIMVISE